MCFDYDDKLLHALDVSGVITTYNLESREIESTYKIDEASKGIACIEGYKVVVAFEKLLMISEKGNTVKEIKLSYKASCVEYSKVTKEILVGDSYVSYFL